MNFLRSLAQYHPDVLMSRIHDVCLALVQEVRLCCSSRSQTLIQSSTAFINHGRNSDETNSVSAPLTIDLVCVSLMKVRNLRSGVSRVAVVTLGEMFAALQKGMDQELDGTVRALLQKAGECNAFIRQDVERALDSMVQHCSLTRSMSALLTGGLGSETLSCDTSSHTHPHDRKQI